MPNRHILTGVILGLAISGLVLALTGQWFRPGPAALGPAGPVFSDCDGRLRELVVQYVAAGGDAVADTLRDFLTQLPADVTVFVVCPAERDFADITRRVGATACPLKPIYTRHPITGWSRDRFIARAPAGPEGPVVLVPPRGEDLADQWPQRAGDAKVAEHLAAALARRSAIEVRRSHLYFDGGDVVADDRTAFVTPRLLSGNLQHTVADRPALQQTLEHILGLRVVQLEIAPDHHAGMYMMALGDGRVAVADPSRAWPLLEPARPAGLCGPEGPDRSSATQALFDAVAEQCRAAGYTVLRVPVVPGKDGRRYVSYTNVMIDQRDGRRVVYLPQYRGLDALNAAARAVWQEAGYEFRLVDGSQTYLQFGVLRCLVNVVSRG